MSLALSQRMPIIAIWWKPSFSGSVTPTTWRMPRSMSRFVRARTAASETPRSAAIWVYGRRPSACRCSMIRLSRAETSSARATGGGRAIGDRARPHAHGFFVGLGVAFGGPDGAAVAGGAALTPGMGTIVRAATGETRGSSAACSAPAATSWRSSGLRWPAPVVGPHSIRMLRPRNGDRRLSAGRFHTGLPALVDSSRLWTELYCADRRAASRRTSR